MSRYADLSGVKTWYDEHGDGEPLVMLHPGAELAIIPGTSHGLLVEKADRCNNIILDFLLNEPVPTLVPIRRAR